MFVHESEVEEASKMIDFSEIKNAGTERSKQYGAHDFSLKPSPQTGKVIILIKMESSKTDSGAPNILPPTFFKE